MEESIYRIIHECGNCPFVDDGKSIHLEEGRVDAIKAKLLTSDTESFNCHKTVYAEGDRPLKMCAGAYKFLKKKNKPNLQMKLAKSMGIE